MTHQPILHLYRFHPSTLTIVYLCALPVVMHLVYWSSFCADQYVFFMRGGEGRRPLAFTCIPYKPNYSQTGLPCRASRKRLNRKLVSSIIYSHASTGAGVQSQRKAVQFPCAVHQGSYRCSCVLWGQHHQSVSWECVALQVQGNTSPSGLQSSREILDILRQCWRKSVSRIW